MSTPLTDAINALTTYANEVTGASDTTLSDAVHTLVDGYGQGGGYTGIEVKTDSNGHITDYILHGFEEVPPLLLNYVGFNRALADGYPTVSFADKPSVIGKSAFRGMNAMLDWSGLTEVEKVGGDYAMSPARVSTLNDTASIVNLPKFRGFVDNTYSGLSLFRPHDNNNNKPYGPLTFNLPVCTVVPMYAWYQYAGTGLSITIGSVGHAVTESKTQPFGGTSNASGTVTIYTDGSHLDAVKTAVQQNAGSNLTFVYKAAGSTTYGGTSYAAGDTILTSTP